MAKIYKTWKVLTDLDIGTKADSPVWVEQDHYSYLIRFTFIRNRKPIADLYEVPGTPFVRFINPNDIVYRYELIDIVEDTATFLIPDELLNVVGTMTMYVGWENQGQEYVLNELFINIIDSPWEVNLIDGNL